MSTVSADISDVSFWRRNGDDGWEDVHSSNVQVGDDITYKENGVSYKGYVTGVCPAVMGLAIQAQVFRAGAFYLVTVAL